MIKAKAVTYVRKCLRCWFMIARSSRYLRFKTPHFAPKELQQCWRVAISGAGACGHQSRVQPLDHAPQAQDSTETTGKGFKYVSFSRLQS
jgi:hypothetical protein